MIQSRALRFRRRTRPASVAAGLTAAVLALTLAACTGGSNPSSSGGNYVESDGGVTRVPKEDRDPAPELTGESTHEEDLALTDYRGQVVVLNVWGSWCAPCRAEAPNLAQVAKETADQDVQFLGINTRDPDRRNAQSFDDGYGIDYPSFYDPKGRLILEFPPNTLSPQGIPSTLILDRDGDIAVSALKALSYDELRDILDPVIAEQ